MATVNVVTDDYNSTKVEDPYRWLEDPKSPATRAWIDQENAYTQQYLSQISTRPQISSQLTALMRVDQYTMPTLRGGKYFFKKRLADENQGSLYMRKMCIRDRNYPFSSKPLSNGEFRMQAGRRRLATLSLLVLAAGPLMLKAQPPTTIHGANGLSLIHI